MTTESDHGIESALEVLTNRVATKEEEVSKLKKLINELCIEAGITPKYENVQSASSATVNIRVDQFYGVAITTAIRSYLDSRKARNLGAAGVTEIYEAIKSGGYKFDTENEENAKTTVRNNLRKSSSIFHRLPNGNYGLLAWYPNAKTEKVLDDAEDTERKTTAKEAPAVTKNGDGRVSHSDVRSCVNVVNSPFRTADVEKLIHEKYPKKELHRTALPTVLNILKKKGKIKVVTERRGNVGGVYERVSG
jgi:hypothetical protein